MFHINVLLTAHEEADVPRIQGWLAEALRLTRAEPGCVRFEVYHSTSDPKVFLLCEWWESEDAWNTHKEAQAVQEIYKPKVLPLVDRVPHISQLVE